MDNPKKFPVKLKVLLKTTSPFYEYYPDVETAQKRAQQLTFAGNDWIALQNADAIRYVRTAMIVAISIVPIEDECNKT